MMFRVLLILAVMALPIAASAEQPTAPVVPESQVATQDEEIAEEVAKSSFFMGAELFTGFRFDSTENDSFNEFTLDRAELTAGFDQHGIGGFFVDFEVVRSAAPNSLIGIDGNSLVARLKKGFAFIDPELGPGRLIGTLGVVPDPWVVTIEREFDIRGLRPIGSERAGFFVSSDLGGTLGYSIWDEMLELTVAFLNGEGRNQIEQNTGKNTTAVLSVRPWRPQFLGAEAELGLHGIFRDGSIGPGQGRNHRFGGAITFHHPRVSVGTELMFARGTDLRSDVDANVLTVWASGKILDPYLGLYGSFDLTNTDESLDDGAIMTIGGGVFTDVVNTTRRLNWRTLDQGRAAPLQRLRLYVGYVGEQYGDEAGAVPGAASASDLHTFQVQLEARGLANIFIK